MNLINIEGFTLINLNKINILLGKNGCGKSRLLKKLDEKLIEMKEGYGRIKYITPERGGTLLHEPSFDRNLIDPNWIRATRRVNQYAQFRQLSISQYKRLELAVLREIESDLGKRKDEKYKFDIYISRLNSLLDNIRINRTDELFEICSLVDGGQNKIDPNHISSGEAELISLGIECLVFSKERIPGKENILFLDEPDVHLHPDLQVRLMYFLKDIVEEGDCKVLIATHSTALIGALENYQYIHLEFMRSGQTRFLFKSINDKFRKILPVFGAHPLSNIFNELRYFCWKERMMKEFGSKQ